MAETQKLLGRERRDGMQRGADRGVLESAPESLAVNRGPVVPQPLQQQPRERRQASRQGLRVQGIEQIGKASWLGGPFLSGMNRLKKSSLHFTNSENAWHDDLPVMVADRAIVSIPTRPCFVALLLRGSSTP